MRTSLKRVLAGTAATAVTATTALVAPMLVPTVASAATVDPGTVTITPSGSPTPNNSATAFTVSLPNGAACPGDASAGWRITSFIAPTSVALSALSFGGTQAPTNTSSSKNLVDALNGSAFRQVSPNAVDGVISNLPQFNLDNYGPGTFPSGTYNVGIACVDTDDPAGTPYTSNVAVKVYAAPITVTSTGNPADGAAQITWKAGLFTAPPAPAIDDPAVAGGGSANGNSQITVDVATAGTDATSYQIYVNGVANGLAVTGTAGFDPAPVTITGLTNGTSYNVTATATNATGTSPQTSPAVVFTPSVVHAAPVVTASPGAGLGTVDVIWTAAGGAPTGYDVTISPAPTSGPATLTVPASGPLTASFANLGGGTHTVTVTPTGYPAGESAPAGADDAVVDSGDGTPATLIQTITVQRDQVNAIVFEQDCDGDLLLGGDGPLAYGTDTCTVDLGPAQLDAAGEYYLADGELWPIRVIDHRDTDKGWKVTGVIDPLFVDGSKSFDANALGWAPKELSQSAALSGGYAMDVVPGPVVAPWSAGQDLKNGAILMESVAAGGVQRGLGTAVYSADLDIKIPVNVASGDYSADITFTLVNKTP